MASTCTVECSRTENPEDIVKNLFDNVMKREWAEVVNIYGKYPWVHKNEITNSGQTALHVAITDPQENYVVVRKLLQHIKRDFDPFDVLNLKNKKGQTLLHLAATNGGKEKMCEIYFKVVGVEKASKLVRVRDNKGRTPLFLAVQYGRLNTFRYLHFILGDTGTDFSFCVRDDGRSILHEAIIKENFGKYVEKLKNEAGWNYVEFDTNTDIESGEVSNIARKNQPLIWSRITSCFGYFVEFIILGMAFIFGYGYTAVRNIYAEKEKHVWADRVLNELLEHATMYDVKLSYFPAGKDESSKIKKKDTPLLIATKYGIDEMVKRIIKKFPMAIYDVDQEGKNILLVAVENRLLKIYEMLVKSEEYDPPEGVIFQKLDKKWNTALHLAATYGESVRPWPVPGAALQMQREIKWLEFVEKNMSPRMLLRTNKEDKTPREIFTESHKDLVKAGGEWLISMATSCSVVAALIVTIAYTSCTTIPGGTDSDSGKRNLGHISMFELFAIASLIALCFSVISLISFLAILTSRHEEQDFNIKLPRKSLLGLGSLFVSIAAMLVTFSAGHFIVFEDKFKYATFPVYAVISFFPLCLFAAYQFPPYFDIFRATFWSPF